MGLAPRQRERVESGRDSGFASCDPRKDKGRGWTQRIGEFPQEMQRATAAKNSMHRWIPARSPGHRLEQPGRTPLGKKDQSSEARPRKNLPRRVRKNRPPQYRGDLLTRDRKKPPRQRRGNPSSLHPKESPSRLPKRLSRMCPRASSLRRPGRRGPNQRRHCRNAHDPSRQAPPARRGIFPNSRSTPAASAWRSGRVRRALTENGRPPTSSRELCRPKALR